MAKLPERLTHLEAPGVVRSLAQSLTVDAPGATGKTCVIDASDLRHFDSSALAVLLECRRKADSLGRKIRIDNAPAKLGQLAKLYGLEEMFDMSCAPVEHG